MSVNPNTSNNVSDHISIEGLAIAKFSRSIFKEMQHGKITAANCTCSVWENFNETIGKLTVWNIILKKIATLFVMSNPQLTLSKHIRMEKLELFLDGKIQVLSKTI